MTTVAIYIRLSRESAESASIETQRAAALTWLKANSMVDADITEYVDSGVSGAKPLEDRPAMREIIRARPSVIIAWKLDRYARNVSEFLRLVAWGESHKVRLATTDNMVNTANPHGRMVATMLAVLAEWERDMIRGRILEGHATRRTQGRWVSGRAPFGYQIVRRDGAAYLAVDEDQAELIRTAVRKLIEEQGTVTGTARIVGLGERQWRRLLKAPTLRGQREHKGKLVCGPDGVTPVVFAEPIITAAQRKAILTRLDALATGKERAPRQAAPLVAGLGGCWKCGQRLNGGKQRTGVPRYRCKTGCVSMTADLLDQRVTDDFHTRWANMAEYSVRLEGGNDMSEAMAEAQEAAERIAAQMSQAGPLMMAKLAEKAEELEAAYASLRAAHDPDVREVLVPTGRTLGDAWAAAEGNTQARTALLADLGLHVTLYPKERAERLKIEWAIGGDDIDLAEYLGDLDAEESRA
ncbi:recombinase family protein [Streptomyces sp. NPDC014864]|uniref:recombinase family protein n=1 Tax=Streptomyces sp. NPDC014864 TaxID=3364924 RepID=UPI003700E36D